uniref:Uncharacterized protein n=1 Tax=Lepeophtheirus salmonis TaxID=72036 RepID=A0A0K2T9J5_LEPSM
MQHHNKLHRDNQQQVLKNNTHSESHTYRCIKPIQQEIHSVISNLYLYLKKLKHIDLF